MEFSHLQIARQGQGGNLLDDLLAQHGLSRRIALRLPSFATAPLPFPESDLIGTMPTLLAKRFAGRWGWS